MLFPLSSMCANTAKHIDATTDVAERSGSRYGLEHATEEGLCGDLNGEADEAAGDGGSITYTGGTGTDEIETNNKLAHGNGEVTFDLGSDTSKDVIIFNNSVAPNNGVVIIQNFDAGEDGTAAEDKMIFKKLDDVDDLYFEQSGSDVIVQSTGSADVYVKLIVADASTSDFNLSIDSNGDLLIN